jgi:hypothetical protein
MRNDSQYLISLKYAILLLTFILGFGVGSQDFLPIVALSVVVVFLSVFILPPIVTVMMITIEE